jgi:hypothetical protein
VNNVRDSIIDQEWVGLNEVPIDYILEMVEGDHFYACHLGYAHEFAFNIFMRYTHQLQLCITPDSPPISFILELVDLDIVPQRRHSRSATTLVHLEDVGEGRLEFIFLRLLGDVQCYTRSGGVVKSAGDGEAVLVGVGGRFLPLYMI